jgi:iron complex outermembrane receptor protein
VSYVGNRPGEFDGEVNYARLYFPAYTTVDARIGVRAGSFEASLYSRNLGNVRGISGGGGDFGALGNTGGYYVQVIQPRTIGLSLSKAF